MIAEPNLSTMSNEQLAAFRRSLLIKILKSPNREPSRLYARIAAEQHRRGVQ